MQYWRARRAVTAACLLFLSVAARASAQQPGCTADQNGFEQARLKINSVHIDSTLSAISAVRRRIMPIEKALPIQEGTPFTCAAYQAAWQKLQDDFAIVLPGQRFRLTVILPTASLCDKCAEKIVDVRFRVYNTDILSSVMSLFDSTPKLDRGLAPQARFALRIPCCLYRSRVSTSRAKPMAAAAS